MRDMTTLIISMYLNLAIKEVALLSRPTPKVQFHRASQMLKYTAIETVDSFQLRESVIPIRSQTRISPSTSRAVLSTPTHCQPRSVRTR
jgi:hypothetical protein